MINAAGGTAVALRVDHTVEEEVETLFQRVERERGRLDVLTAKHAAPYMIRNRRGLIVEVTENDVLSAGGNPITQTVKLALKGLALNMAAELRPHGVTAVAVTPGFLRSETVLERFGVTRRPGAKAGRKIGTFWNQNRRCS